MGQQRLKAHICRLVTVRLKACRDTKHCASGSYQGTASAFGQSGSYQGTASAVPQKHRKGNGL
jgi:hypothetical protein